MLYLLIFLIFFLLFYFTHYWNSTTSSLSLNYLYFLSLFVLKNKKCNFLLCSSNCTHFFFNIYTFFNLSPSLYLFIFPNILPWYHSSSFLLSSFIIIILVKICHSHFHSLHNFLSQKSGYFPLFLPQFFGGFLFFLLLYFSLIKFCIV